MTPLDLFIYCWAGVFLLAFAVGFPPLALLFLLFPRWHRKRLERRRAAAALADYRRRMAIRSKF